MMLRPPNPPSTALLRCCSTAGIGGARLVRVIEASAKRSSIPNFAYKSDELSWRPALRDLVGPRWHPLH